MSNLRAFGARGDGQADDTAALEHAIEQGDGRIRLPRGSYRITRTIEIDVAARGPVSIEGSGGTARIVMAAPGPALRLLGTHDGTGDPGTRSDSVRLQQRMPTISGLEITGEHPEADGIELVGTMQPILTSLLIHGVRHGIRLHKRNRNVLINHCHLYNNTGIGIFFDEVNLHQVNITGNHISYNRLGGIRLERSEVRNLQITGNDIEYNNHAEHGTEPEPTAEIYVDVSAAGASVNEVTVASNTIQATPSEGGANIFIRDDQQQNLRPGLWTISGNIIGNQQNNIHLIGCRGMVISGNSIYSAANRNLLLEKCELVTIGNNNFRRHSPSLGSGVRLVDSSDCILNACSWLDDSEQGQASGASLLELVRCQRISVGHCQLLDGVPLGIDVVDSSWVTIANCLLTDRRSPPLAQHLVRFRGRGEANLLNGNQLGSCQGEPTSLAASAGVRVRD
jgi:hypothetical protein